jgi:hypothetical protein
LEIGSQLKHTHREPARYSYYSQKFGHRPGLNVVIICLADSSQKVHGIGITKAEFENLEHISLCFENLFIRIAPFGKIEKVLNTWAQDFFILGSDKHSSETNELQLIKTDGSKSQESVNNVLSQKECLRK